jgi:hypothetical protein
MLLGRSYFADLRMTFRQNFFLHDWFRNKFGVGSGLVFGIGSIGLVLVKGLLYFAKRNFAKLYFAKLYFAKLHFAKLYFEKLYFAKLYFVMILLVELANICLYKRLKINQRQSAVRWLL